MPARAATVVKVHPGPYRCLYEGCPHPAVVGEGFSLSRRGVGLCHEHKPKGSPS